MSGTTVWGGDKTHGNAVAVCQGFEREENRANAALIASAPDLLEALRDMVDEVAAFAQHNDCPLPVMSKFYIAAKNAIAKAGG